MAVQPFFFGDAGRRLFGVYHPAEGERGRAPAVVLCHPFGHEYLRAHRAFRNLAAAIAARGCHVLRFDYFGTGDSAGSSGDNTLTQALSDVAAAIDEVKDIADVTQVTLVGLRIGATLTALAAADRPDVDRLILWDPILAGEAYLDDLTSLQGRWLEDRLGPAAPSLTDSEVIGFTLSPESRRQLGAMRIMPPPKLRARSVSLFLSEDHAAYQSFRQSLEAGDVPVACQVLSESNAWDRGDMVHQILLPHEMVRAITAEVCS